MVDPDEVPFTREERLRLFKGDMVAVIGGIMLVLLLHLLRWLHLMR